MDRRLFYLLGGNGAPNFGDELMAKGWIDYLSTGFPDARIVLDCNSVATPKAYLRRALPERSRSSPASSSSATG